MKKVVLFLIVVFMVGMITGCSVKKVSVKKVKELTDAEKFVKEFGITVKNPFVYIGIDNIFKLLENDTGIIFFANSDYEGSIKAATYLTQVAKIEEVKKIYYYNPKKLEEKNPKRYKKLTEELKIDDFKLPEVCAVKNGEVINCSNYFSKEEEISEEYLTKSKIQEIKENYTKIINYEECSDCR